MNAVKWMPDEEYPKLIGGAAPSKEEKGGIKPTLNADVESIRIVLVQDYLANHVHSTTKFGNDDDQAGGTGKGWYRIVRDPEEASAFIAANKLAVILGTEVQHLFNCDIDRPACSPEAIDEGLNRLEAMGINYVFPVHHKLDQFAGPATFQPLNSGPAETCPDLGYECSSIGLTRLGQQLIEKLASRGMLIDTEHMSRKAFDEAMTTVEGLVRNWSFVHHSSGLF